MQRLHLRAGLFALVALVGSGLAACGGDDGPSVTIYSGRSENQIAPILEEFAKATGIDVEVRYDQSADLALRIVEEGDATRADVYLSQSPGAVGFLDGEGLLDTVPDDILALVPEGAHAADGSWVGFSGRQRVLVYNTDNVDPTELPASVLDMVGPEWNGRVGIAPSNGSFQDFVSAMRERLGDDATRAWLEGMAANDPVTYPSNNAIVAAIGRGEIDVGLVNHYYNYQRLAEDPGHPGANHQFADDDIGSLVIVTAAAIVKGTDSPDEAAELLRWLLAEDAQRYFSDVTFEYPLANGIAPSADLPPLSFDRLDSAGFGALGADLETTRTMIRDAGLEG
ncbi:MAG: extracellular solute-binding protein [Acidimicrobiales bacterium]|nr:extracellular solute-binding protein [Acidimicrobiales bacterium]